MVNSAKMAMQSLDGMPETSLYMPQIQDELQVIDWALQETSDTALPPAVEAPKDYLTDTPTTLAQPATLVPTSNPSGHDNPTLVDVLIGVANGGIPGAVSVLTGQGTTANQAIGDAGSNVVSSTLSTWLKKNWGYVVLAVVAVTALGYGVVKLLKRK